jgi:hypothetical protein
MSYQALEILTEEPSMEYFLRGLLPRILPPEYVLDQNCFIRPHQGKSDLRKSIPKKMRAYPRYGYPVKVLIVHDQDSNDCVALKQTLIELTNSSPHDIPFLVRIACRELENWYLGDFESLEKVYPEINASQQIKKTKFRTPDNVFGSHEISLLTDSFSKTSAARALGPIIRIDSNASQSFQHFVNGISRLLEIG